MSRYSKIDRRMWGDEKFRKLSPLKPSAQALWIYLLTGPHNTGLPGLFVAGEAALAELLCWKVRSIRRCFDELCLQGMTLQDRKLHLVYIPGALRYNTPTNDSVVIGWFRLFDELPECALKRQAGEAFARYLATREAIQLAHAQRFAPHLSITRPLQESLSDSAANAESKGVFNTPLNTLFDGDTKGDTTLYNSNSNSMNNSNSAIAEIACTESVCDGSLPAEVVMTFPVDGKGKKTWHLTAKHIAEWQQSFPALDITAECRKALAWINANPSRRKTHRGMPAFLVNWFSRAQNNNRSTTSSNPASKRESVDDRIDRLFTEGGLS